jgi:hypothetical protein
MRTNLSLLKQQSRLYILNYIQNEAERQRKQIAQPFVSAMDPPLPQKVPYIALHSDEQEAFCFNGSI